MEDAENYQDARGENARRPSYLRKTNTNVLFRYTYTRRIDERCCICKQQTLRVHSPGGSNFLHEYKIPRFRKYRSSKSAWTYM